MIPVIEEVSRNEMLSTIHYMTEHFPYRLAGSPCEAAASRYVTERLKQYGLEVENKEFYTYNSDPMYSKVTVLEPEMEIDSLPCAHIRATKPEGEIFELIYVGNGDYAAYKDIDVTGKMVLVEVSYAPPVPEKARIAYEMGAAGIMCMNWGNDEEVICRRGLKGVWGNPTEANFHCIPEIVGVGVTRGAGLKLKQLCLEGRKVEVKVTAIADRTWSIVHQPTAILHGNGSSDEFLLVCSHLDAWKPGVTCNATGNATTLEICRILSKHRQELDRDVYFVFWDGHEVAEAAGSTWFVDNNWDNLNKHCVCYMHIDSTGVKETELYEIKASEELLGFAKKNINDVLPELELRAMALKKIGDQSFMGIGVSSITQRKSFTKEYMEHAHGATLGWWNHTIEDGEDKCDPVALEEDTRATLKVLYDLATAKLLPYDFSDKISVFRANVQKVADKFGDHMDFTDLQDNLKTVEHQVNEIQAMKEGLSNEQAKLYNEFVKMVARQITNVTMTCADKYSQDSYGYTSLSYPIPLFADFERLVKLDPASLEYPVKLTAKAILFIVLAYYADEIVNIALTIGGTPYAWILSSELPSLDFASFNSVLLTIIGVCANGGVALIVLILTLILAWNYIKLLFEAAERYVLLGVLVYTAPVAFAMGASQSTANIFKSWCRMFGGQIFLLLMNAWCLRLFITMVGTFISNPLSM